MTYTIRPSFTTLVCHRVSVNHSAVNWSGCWEKFIIYLLILLNNTMNLDVGAFPYSSKRGCQDYAVTRWGCVAGRFLLNGTANSWKIVTNMRTASTK
jgi:hypothetical protein